MVLRFYKTKQLAVFRNFRVISMRFAVFLLFCALLIHNFLRFCGIRILLYAPILTVSHNGNPIINKTYVEIKYTKNLTLLNQNTKGTKRERFAIFTIGIVDRGP